MTSNKCFSGNWHVQPSLRTTFMRTNLQDGYKKGAHAQSVLENAQDTSGMLEVTMKVLADGAGYSWGGGEWAQHTNHHGVQSVQEQECQLGHLEPAAMLIFHHQEERPNLPANLVQKASGQAVATIASSREEDSTTHGSQQRHD
jgi:hypothetical protein